ncbi:MAG TPA: C13 family peptidase [Stellaceae bacterium]|nr:C13 family peptidase [Stellaceae bacterium]
MRKILATLALALALIVPLAARAAGTPQPAGWKALLIAGDDRELAFDDAVDAMARKLEDFGVPSGDITVLKSSGDAGDAATRANVEAAFADLHPGPADGCFVFVTSHGAEGRGLFIRRANAFLSPHTLNVLLGRGCGRQPSVVIASGCYSGIFAEGPPLAAANRVILTAARDDRPSFGCNANLKYTVFDHCILDNLRRGEMWRMVMAKTRACVSGNEWDMRVRYPSEPQLAVGAGVATLRAFAR